MKKILSIVFCLSFIILQKNNCFSQDSIDNHDENKQTNKQTQHTIYTEFLGNSGLYSLGYDYTLKLKEENKLSFSCGFSYIPDFRSVGPKEHTFVISPQISYLNGKIHHLELGVGFTYESSHYDNNITSNWAIPFRIGYRYQQENGGLFFKAAYTPALLKRFLTEDYWFMPFWGGVAIGYTF